MKPSPWFIFALGFSFVLVLGALSIAVCGFVGAL